MKALVLVTGLLLAGCGQIYIAPNVSNQLDETNVSIVPLTPQVAASANQSSYRPRSLPAVFFQNAGTGSRGESAALIATRLPPAVQQKPYQIGVGDVVVLATPQSATSIEELSGLLAAQNQRQGYTVQDDGAIAIPNVGRVQLAGLDLQAAEAEVFQALVSRQLDPTFSIEVAEFNSKRVSVGGAVRSPQTLPITLTPLTLQEAVTVAGGTTALDTQFVAVRLYRDDKLYQVPFEKLQTTDVTLLQGDSIVLESGFQLSEALTEVDARRSALNEERSNFKDLVAADAVDRDFVYLTGEVKTQGRFPLPFGRQATLADALFAQGGAISNTGNPAEIYLLRGHENDRVTAFHLDGSNPVTLLNATKLQLRPNDIVFVAPQPVTNWNRALQPLLPSLIVSTVARIAD
ncbi:MAG: polysaccharide biosynthesis/export family protein [Pacificibacter sp.]|uniref:polysaccharide biosynthesis/export family protein n=1 Tax=Pacificibacter sp. TaxID=1917866 RepID=UPI0032196DD3